MADSTAAQRQRRYRAHRRGDHSLCPPGRADCVAVTAENGVTPPVTASRVTDSGRNLGERGRRLWQDVTKAGPELTPSEQVLLEEACRTADRLDQLDRILRGDEDCWVSLHSVNEDGSIVKVVLNQALAEARQQQTTLKQLVAELRQSRGGGAAKPGRGGQRPANTSAPRGGGVADLTARIAARKGAAG